MDEAKAGSQVFAKNYSAQQLVPPVNHGERQLPVFCPQCGQRIEIQRGLCGNRIIDAILLQAERIGTELECQRCDTRFVFQKLDAIESHQRQKERNKTTRSH